MPFDYAAFLSYSHRDAPWVEVLQNNLETSLQALGHHPSDVYRDETDLAPGRSWVTGLQQGLDRAPKVILVATPEAMASPRVKQEFESLIDNRSDWDQGRLLPIRLVDCPLPPFLGRIRWIDFREHDETKYRSGLKDLLGALLDHRNRRNPPQLPEDLTIPDPPTRGVPPQLRRDLVVWLEEVLQEELAKIAVPGLLKLPHFQCDEHPSLKCAASALLVANAGDEDPVKALQRLIRVLSEGLAKALPSPVTKLEPFREKLDALQAGGGLERLWLDKVARDHGRLERYFQRETDLDLLARVFVEIDLAPEHRKASAKTGRQPEETLNAPTQLSELLELEPGSAPWVTGRWVILGDPGAGKTTLLRHLAASLGRDDSPRWVPVYESLPRWLREPESLPQRLERRLRRAGHPAQGFPALFDQWARDNRLLLLLDGLDEVPREDRSEAEELVRDLVARWPETPIVVASRPIGYRPPAGRFTEVRLLPLDRVRRRELLARWLGREKDMPDWNGADQALEVLGSDRALWELSGNPLYLTLMAMLLEDEKTPERNRARLYDQIFELLMEGKHRRTPEPMDAQEVTRGVLRRLAYGMTSDNRDAEPLTVLEGRLLEEELDPLRKKLDRRPRWRHSLRRFFTDLAERTGILGPHDGEDADWRYWHRTFREALTAERLEEITTKEGTESVLAQAGGITAEEDASRWAEPFALLTGRVEEPDRLVRELVEANRPLGLRALSSARTLQADTVPEILGLTGDVEDRAKVYQELPRLLPDGHSLLALVDRLRSETRNGNDLFWLDWIVRQVGEGDSGLKSEADALLARFFDHIPAPPVELFTQVDTPHDGQVALWREIPAGEFWMGSREGAEGADEDEHPRHRVEVASSYRMAAVSVTREQYAAFDPEHTSYEFSDVPEGERIHHPVNQVTWYAAVAFCRWLSQALPETAGARLPIEAEWEYACRAGTETAYWNGDSEQQLEQVGWYDENSEGRTHRVGEKPANPWGLYDVHGNVFDWTLSAWTDDYSERKDGVVEDPAVVTVDDEVGDDPGGGRRVIRGGSYARDALWARSAFRIRNHPWNVWLNHGFRVVLPAAPSGRS
jgi:formylglycine-generating enzyme required for sulfatase activity